jgi:hypothetical protein
MERPVLTKEQEASAIEFGEKWLKIGTSCDPLDYGKAKKAAIKCYKIAKKPIPKLFLHAKSPISCAMMAALLKAIEFGVGTKIKTIVQKIGANAFREEFEEYFKDLRFDGLETEEVHRRCTEKIIEVVSNFCGNKKSKILPILKKTDDLMGTLIKHITATVGRGKSFISSHVGSQMLGCHEAAWLLFYEFFGTIYNLEDRDKLEGLVELAQHCGWWDAYEDVAILQDRPELMLFEGNDIGCTTGPAIKYRDGVSIWRINGIPMPAYICDTPAEKLDPFYYTTIQNNEVRREFIRKVGVERLLSVCPHKLLDMCADKLKKGASYELYRIDFGIGMQRVYLKMVNHSEGIFHLEPVHPDCGTIREALNYRRYGVLSGIEDWDPEVLT